MNTVNTIDAIPSHSGTSYDVICFSHLRWDFVFQRPQHLLSRFAGKGRVFFWEEPVYDSDETRLEVSRREGDLWVIRPTVAKSVLTDERVGVIRSLLDGFVEDYDLQRFLTWYYTPMMLPWSRHLDPELSLYDCMDELSAFKNAPAELKRLEAELFATVDLVLTGGHSLYESKRDQHRAVHCYPSSIDKAHFGKARAIRSEPQADAVPTIGFFGVIDERMDLQLLDELATLRPAWQFVLIGPVVKISTDTLPKRGNIEYLGSRSYDQLPGYIAGWDVGFMPFAINESTQFISPTKTPEFLSAGVPVVSTPIRDVVSPYGEKGLVSIAANAPEFVAAIEDLLKKKDETARLRAVDNFLSDMSWDSTYESISELIDRAMAGRYIAASA